MMDKCSLPETKRGVKSAAIPLESRRVCRLNSGRRTDEFWRAAERNPRRLRTPILGSKHQRIVRTSFLLCSVCIAGPLLARDTKFSSRASEQLDRIVWRPGVVSRRIWRNISRSLGFPAIAFAGVFHFKRLVFSAGLTGFVVARASASRGSTVVAGGFCIDAACVGNCASQTLRGGNNGARVKRERSLHRLLHLLHAGEYRRCSRAVHGVLGTPTHAGGKRISRGGVKRIPDVFCGSVALQRTSAIE